MQHFNDHIHILIVDDTKLNRSILNSFIESISKELNIPIQLFEAVSGEEAIENIAETKPDLILMDYHMYKINGIEALQIIKSNFQNKWIPSIIVSGEHDVEIMTKGLEVADDYITKPFVGPIMKSKLRNFLKSAYLSKKELLIKDEKKQEEELARNIILNSYSNNDSNKHLDIFTKSISDVFSGDGAGEIATENSKYFFLFDSIGHGLPAAIILMIATDVFQAMAKKESSIYNIAKEISRKLKAQLPSGYYVAGILGRLYNNELEIVNAGMPTAYATTSEGENLELKSKNLPLGISTDIDIEIQNIKIHNNISIIMASDGLLEIGTENFLPTTELINKLLPFIKSLSSNDIYNIFTKYYNQSVKDDVSVCIVNYSKKTNKDLILHNHYTKDDFINNNFIDNVIQDLSTKILLDIAHTTSLSEILINSLEHGLLKMPSNIKHGENGFEEYYTLKTKLLNNLSSGQIEVSAYKLSSGQIELIIKDTGKGFNISEYIINILKNNNNLCFFGRGIELAIKLTNSFLIQENGTKISLFLQPLDTLK